MAMLKLLCCCIFLWGACENRGRSAIPNYSIIKSPSHDYSLRISTRSKDRDAGRSFEILHHGAVVAHYLFEGELANAYWNPSGSYVAINNHSGYNGWWLWIVSVKDGRIIKAKGTVANSNYNRYADYQYLPDLFDSEEAQKAIGSVYRAFDFDQIRAGYTTIAYRWRKDGLLFVHHRLLFDRLAKADDSMVQVLEIYRVKPTGITTVKGSVRAKRVKLSDEEKEAPEEVKALFE